MSPIHNKLVHIADTGDGNRPFKYHEVASDFEKEYLSLPMLTSNSTVVLGVVSFARFNLIK